LDASLRASNTNQPISRTKIKYRSLGDMTAQGRCPNLGHMTLDVRQF
jgi:hypothetical protein